VSAVCCRRSAVFRRFARSCLRTMVMGPGCRPRAAVHDWRYSSEAYEAVDLFKANIGWMKSAGCEPA
jgi:hypothetical protein